MENNQLPKLQNCDLCRWFAAKESELFCKKGNNPVFVEPENLDDWNFGYKCLCSNFQRHYQKQLPATLFNLFP